MINQLNEISGNKEAAVTHQTGNLLKMFDETQRQRILEDAKIPNVELDAQTMVAMKVDLSIPWERLKTMAR